MAFGMGLHIALFSIGKRKFDSMNLLLMQHPISALNRRCTCFKMWSTPKKNWGKSRTMLISFRHFMAKLLAMTPTAISAASNMHQRGELGLPRGMCMLMTLLTMRMVNSMRLTTWIVTLWTSKLMCTSRTPRILYLLEIEHFKNHVLLHFLQTDHSRKHVCLASNGIAFSQKLMHLGFAVRWSQGHHFGSVQGSWEANGKPSQHQCIWFPPS